MNNKPDDSGPRDRVFYDPSRAQDVRSMHDILKSLHPNSGSDQRSFAIIWAVDKMGAKERTKVVEYASTLLRDLPASQN